jgi:hypothetical protein
MAGDNTNDEPAAMEEEEETPTPIPDMSQAQDIFLLELAQTHPKEVPDAQQVRSRLLEKVRTRSCGAGIAPRPRLVTGMPTAFPHADQAR